MRGSYATRGRERCGAHAGAPLASPTARGRGRRGNYSPAELATWRRRIAAWRARTIVYAYFNNDREAFAPRNALALTRGLS